jgi:hypothetical protein
MNATEFRELMADTSDADMLPVCLVSEDRPFVCNNDAKWTSFRRALVDGMQGLALGDVRVVGSGRHGFSTRPRARFKAFDDSSDIDVVVVNETIFDQVWIALLVAAYPRLAANRQIGRWNVEGREELFAGWLTPTSIHMDWRILGARGRPLSEFKLKWFNALKLAAGHSTKPHHDITGRLYRTWRHAELYHLFSIAQLRRSLALESAT